MHQTLQSWPKQQRVYALCRSETIIQKNGPLGTTPGSSVAPVAYNEDHHLTEKEAARESDRGLSAVQSFPGGKIKEPWLRSSVSSFRNRVLIPSLLAFLTVAPTPIPNGGNDLNNGNNRMDD